MHFSTEMFCSVETRYDMIIGCILHCLTFSGPLQSVESKRSDIENNTEQELLLIIAEHRELYNIKTMLLSLSLFLPSLSF